MPRSVQRGLPATDYYAPDYLVEVEGQQLDPTAKGDVRSLKVAMDIANMTSFELSINNWDDKGFDFKYSDSRIFDVGNRVHVQMGYADRLLSMVRGQITTLTPQFPDSGPPTIGVSGVDGMLRLRDRKPVAGDQKKFPEMADWEIAQVIAARNGLAVKVTKEGEKHAIVVQKNQDDATFLMERAKRIDFDCYVQTDPDSGQDTLYFVKPSDARDAGTTRVYTLAYRDDTRGASSTSFEHAQGLVRFSPKLTVSRQVAKVTVRGWDPRTKAAIKYTASSKDLPGAKGKGTSGPEMAAKRLGGKQEVVIDAPVTSDQEARDLAISLLRERAYDFITGSGQAIGLPDLRPGDNLDLLGLGTRFSGRYYVTKVEHSLGDAGYRTGFDVRRVYDGGLKK